MSGVGKPFSNPVQTDMTDSPAKTLFRSVSRSEGFVKRPTPICRHVPDQLGGHRLLRTLAGGLDDDLQRPPIRQRAQIVAVAVRQPDLIQELVGLVDVEGGPCRQIGFVEQRALRQYGVAALGGEPQIDHLVDLAAIDAERQRAAEADVADERMPRGIGTLRLGARSAIPPSSTTDLYCRAPRSPSAA
jgi:hypothetical protein